MNCDFIIIIAINEHSLRLDMIDLKYLSIYDFLLKFKSLNSLSSLFNISFAIALTDVTVLYSLHIKFLSALLFKTTIFRDFQYLIRAVNNDCEKLWLSKSIDLLRGQHVINSKWQTINYCFNRSRLHIILNDVVLKCMRKSSALFFRHQKTNFVYD